MTVHIVHVRQEDLAVLPAERTARPAAHHVRVRLFQKGREWVGVLEQPGLLTSGITVSAEAPPEDVAQMVASLVRVRAAQVARDRAPEAARQRPADSLREARRFEIGGK